MIDTVRVSQTVRVLVINDDAQRHSNHSLKPIQRGRRAACPQQLDNVQLDDAHQALPCRLGITV